MRLYRSILLLSIVFVIFSNPISGQRVAGKSQIRLLQESRMVVVAGVEKYGSLPSLNLDNGVNICQTVLLRVDKVLKGRSRAPRIRANVRLILRNPNGLEGVLNEGEKYIFILEKLDSVDECHYENLTTGESRLVAPPGSKIPSYQMEFEGTIRGNAEEIQSINQVLLRLKSKGKG